MSLFGHKRPAPLLASSSADGDVVHTVGIVRAGKRTLEAPLTGARCVAARSSCKAYDRWGAYEEVIVVPFVLERVDGDRDVVIRSEHAVIEISPIAVPDDSSATSRRERFVLREGLAGSRGNRLLKLGQFREVAITPGMMIAVTGILARTRLPPDADHELGFRDDAPLALQLWGDAEHPIVIADAPVREAT